MIERGGTHALGASAGSHGAMQRALFLSREPLSSARVIQTQKTQMKLACILNRRSETTRMHAAPLLTHKKSPLSPPGHT